MATLTFFSRRLRWVSGERFISRCRSAVGGFLSVWALFFSNAARADIVMMDLNISPSEVAAAERAATARGEKLHIFPVLSKKTRAELSRQMSQIEAYSKQLEGIWEALEEETQPEAIARLKMAKEELSAQKAAVESSFEQKVAPLRLSLEDVKRDVAALSKAGGKVRSLILSGHSSGERFSGVIGSVDQGSFAQWIQSDSSISDHLEGLYLWGCYTGTLSSTLQWRETLQNVPVVMGFHKQAPLASTVASPQILESALRTESELVRARTVSSVKDLVSSLDHAKNFPVGALVNDCYVGTRIKSRKIGGDDVECAIDSRQLRDEYVSIYAPALYGSDGDAILPSSPKLRAFYTLLQKNRHCKETQKLGVEPGTVIALIHWREVMANFVARHERDLDRLLDELDEHQADEDGAIRDAIDKLRDGLLTRSEMVGLGVRLDQIELQHQQRKRGLLSGASENFLSEPISTNLVHLECIPLSWLEAPASGQVPEEAQCGNRSAVVLNP